MTEILITGIEMPNDGQTLHLGIKSDGKIATISGCKIKSKAIEVPPHGRLIDADKLIASFRKWANAPIKRTNNEIADFLEEYSIDSTIIEASEEKSK